MPCKACGGKGYLVATACNRLQSVHGRERNVDLLEIQRCDACPTPYTSDDAAQKAFLQAVIDRKEKLPALLLLHGEESIAPHRKH